MHTLVTQGSQFFNGTEERNPIRYPEPPSNQPLNSLSTKESLVRCLPQKSRPSPVPGEKITNIMAGDPNTRKAPKKGFLISLSIFWEFRTLTSAPVIRTCVAEACWIHVRAVWCTEGATVYQGFDALSPTW